MAATASMASSSRHSLTQASHGMSDGPSKRTRPIRVPPRISLADLTPNNIGTLRKLNSVLFPVSYSDRFYKEVLSPELEDYCKLVYYNDIPVGAICCRIERDAPTEETQAEDAKKHATGKLYLMTLGVLAPYRRQGLASKLLDHVIEKATEASLAASLAPHVADPSTTSSETLVASTAPTNNTSNAAATTTKPDKKAGKNKGKATTAAAAASSQPDQSKDKKAADESAAKGSAEATKNGVAPSTTTSSPPVILQSVFVHVQINNPQAKEFWEAKGFSERELVKDYYKKNIEGPRDAWVLERDIQI